MLSLIQRMIYGPRVVTVIDIPMMRDCLRCKSSVSMRMANRLIVHLIEDHNLPEQQAYDTVNWVFERLRDHLNK
jgi:hypothetical protein